MLKMKGSKILGKKFTYNARNMVAFIEDSLKLIESIIN